MEFLWLKSDTTGKFAASQLLRQARERSTIMLVRFVALEEMTKICLKNVVRITYREYCRKRKEMIEESNAVVNYRYDRKLNLIERGFNISSTTDEIENERNKYLR